MTAGTGKSLWPVLTVLVGLVAGAGIVEAMVEEQQAPEVRIAIEGGAAVVDTDRDPVATEEESPLAEPGAAVDAQHERARTLARRGDLEEALAAFAEVVAAHPQDADLRADHAFWLIRAGREREAIAELERAREIRPDDPYSAFILATAHRHLGDAEAAERWYREALRLGPSLASARVAFASFLLHHHRADEAREVVGPAARSGSNADRARASCVLGQAHLALGDRDAADRAFREAVERAPAQPEIRIEIARALVGSGAPQDVDRAVVLLEQASTISPDLPSVHASKGRVLEQLGDRSGAERAYRKALSLDPGYRYARRRLLRIALRSANYARAREHARDLLTQDPTNPEHHFLAALVAARQGALDEARGHYRDAIEAKDGNYPEAWFNLGLLERSADRPDEALAAYQRAVELDPRYRTAWNNMGLVLASLGRAAEAEAAYRRALALRADYGPALVNLAMLLSGAGRHDEAVALLSRAIEARSGDYPRARLNLGVVQARAGHLREALATDLALTEAEPRYAVAFHNLGEVYAELGRGEEALAAFRRAVELDAERTSSREQVATLLAQRGEVEQARRAYEELLDREPSNQAARRAVASLYLQLGDRDRCRRNARLAVAGDPSDRVARQLLSGCSGELGDGRARPL